MILSDNKNNPGNIQVNQVLRRLFQHDSSCSNLDKLRMEVEVVKKGVHKIPSITGFSGFCLILLARMVSKIR